MSEIPTNSQDSPGNYPSAHPGAEGDPVLIGELLPGILDAEANTEPPSVTAARAELTSLIGTKERGSETVSDEALAQAREKLNRAIRESTTAGHP